MWAYGYPRFSVLALSSTQEAGIVSNTLIFIFGVIATIAAIGPLLLAFYLDLKEDQE
jgi:hypothetical protein